MLGDTLHELISDLPGLPGQLRGTLESTIDRSVDLGEQIGTQGNQALARKASDALYHATSAVLLANEGARLAIMRNDARRLVLAHLVLSHRLLPQDPLAASSDDDAATLALLSPQSISLDDAQSLLV